MKVLDLFCGTKSIANVFAERGHEVFTVDWEKNFNPTLCADIGTLSASDIINLCGGVPDVIWASPDCTTFSIAAISHHRERSVIPADLCKHIVNICEDRKEGIK